MTELLSPAGTPEAFRAALSAGADAVYAGCTRFSARANAGNFTTEELLEAIDEAHLLGRKLYLTVNILMKPEELRELPDFLAPFYRAGLDGVIVQDLGVIALVREQFPLLPVHASTQLALTSRYGAAFLAGLGVKRVVPARELTLGELRELVGTGMEIEVFIHGAMCYSCSGMCLMSSFLGGRSGNRGRCAGSCRQPFSVGKRGREKEESYLLSMKDLCTLSLLPRIVSAGVSAMKIEGRMKPPEYVFQVTALYRKYLDRLSEDPEAARVEEEDLKILSGLYVRGGLSEGYLKRHNGPDMITFSKGGYRSENERESLTVKMPSRRIQGVFEARLGEGMRLFVETEDQKASVWQEGGRAQKARTAATSDAEIRKQLMKTGGSGFSFSSLEIRRDEGLFLPVSALNALRREALDALRKEALREYRREL